MPDQLYTVGHGTQSIDHFIDLLARAGVKRIVDVRAHPGSRTNPQFGKDALGAALERAGIDYGWEPRLGGRRRASSASPNTALENAAFRAYADYMRNPEFWTALDALLQQARSQPSAIMCAESVWWRCHRRLIADAASLVRGFQVVHIMPGLRLTQHRPTAGVRRADSSLLYDVAQERKDGS